MLLPVRVRDCETVSFFKKNFKYIFLIVQAGLDRHVRVGRRKVISEFIQKLIAEKRSYFTSSPHQVWKIK